MLSGVFLKTIRDRWKGWLIAFVSLVLMFWMAIAVYSEIDVGFLEMLPEVYRSMIGLPEKADLASLAINAMMGTYGALTVAAMALAMGAGLIATEERKGTLGLLLANPRSRTRVLAAKTLAMVVFSAACIVALGISVVALTGAMDISIEGMDVVALCVHMLFLCVFHGMLALGVGAWTGNRGAALGVSIGLLLVSFVGSGVLPLLEGTEDLAKLLPWHYFTGSEPLLNGIHWGHIGVLAAASAAFTAMAFVGVNRRDLKGQSTGVTILDRIRANPMTEKLIGRLAGAARVSSIWVKTASEYQVHLLLISIYMFSFQGLMMGPLYAAIPSEARAAADQAFSALPEAMFALFGGGGMGSPEAFYQIETFGMMAPVGVMVVAIAIGAGALAGEEGKRTMGLLLANPIKRSRVVAAKTITMLVYSAAVGLVLFAGVAAGFLVGGLDTNLGNIASACTQATLCGLVFGSLALALGAGTGRKKIAVWGAVGAAIALHVYNALAQLSDALVGWEWLSPFHFYLDNDPLLNGMDWGNAGILAAISVVLIGASFVMFQRRDLRQGA